MASAPVELSAYDLEWPAKFKAEKAFLIEVIGHWRWGSVEHVGSTAVSGLLAKPVIDIMFGVKSLEVSRPAIDVLTRNGYQYFPYKPDVMHWFCKPSDAVRTHHLHLIPYESELWQERIRFRDLLRSNRAIASDYAALKQALAERYHYDREAYTQAKWPFIQRVLEMAK
ncbi:GrpB family protein [Leptolyngbyaceae cyanobacterium CCMR0082]|uniref:GrpB family protein n=2 Tax=Adonisia turfae TaxID=2950184 RepID=A0A6M0S915_9CYAN|nr:GrpB family protein [Adonisia turfae]NEZ54272.1 GrpB family protein [Adonisia turfae CCMR0081]NEZ64471.1 GrpB family protein [Adonisia turfae CCMR0082]